MGHAKSELEENTLNGHNKSPIVHFWGRQVVVVSGQSCDENEWGCSCRQPLAEILIFSGQLTCENRHFQSRCRKYEENNSERHTKRVQQVHSNGSVYFVSAPPRKIKRIQIFWKIWIFHNSPNTHVLGNGTCLDR